MIKEHKSSMYVCNMLEIADFFLSLRVKRDHQFGLSLNDYVQNTLRMFAANI